MIAEGARSRIHHHGPSHPQHTQIGALRRANTKFWGTFWIPEPKNIGEGFVATEASLLLVLETDELRTTVTVGRPARAALKILAVLFEKMLGGTGTNADYAAPQVFQDVSSGRGCYGYFWGW